MSNKDIIIEKTKKLLETHCYPGLKTAANEWLEAIGTDKEKEAAKNYLAVLEDSVMDIDSVINLFDSDEGVKKFGAEMANKIASHAKEVKARGGKYCDCPACSAGLELLKYKEDLLA